MQRLYLMLFIMLWVMVTGLAGVAQGSTAMPVSPGDASGNALVGQNCPTFSWSLADGAVSYRVEVYEQQTTELLAHEVMSAIAHPIRIREIAAPALTWTPSVSECLVTGLKYVWYVRGADKDGGGQWSMGTGFEIDATALSAEQRDAIYKAVKEYLTTDVGKTALLDAVRSGSLVGVVVAPLTVPGDQKAGTVKGTSASSAQESPLAPSTATGALTIGPNGVYIDGANLYVRNGSGSTSSTVNGLGNVIIGYDEARSSGSDKTGSHNLVVGRNHNYTSSEGIVAGYNNTISASGAVVTGGLYNTASAMHSSVCGGSNSTASGWASSITGGQYNTASGLYASVSGGEYNEASGDFSFVGGGGSTDAASGNKAFANYSAVLGGFQNQAGDVPSGNHSFGAHSTVSGGSYNIARGNDSTVSGGSNNVVTTSSYGGSVSGGANNWVYGNYASISGGGDNTASGSGASVSGGSHNTASGENASVSGGYTNTASWNSSSVSGGSSNTAGAYASTVSGGYNKNTSIDYSCASCLP